MATHAQERPTSPKDLITEAEVKKVLLADKGNTAKLISFDIVDFMKAGDNYSRYVTSILVEYSLEGKKYQSSYVAKVNPCRPFENLKSHIQRAAKKEATFFLELVPQLNSILGTAEKEGLNFPKCFHANLESGKEQLYFEDLRERDFKMVDKKKGLDVHHSTLVVRALARFHAAWHLLCSKNKDDVQKYEYLLQNHVTCDKEAKEATLSVMAGNCDFTVEVLKKVGGSERTISWINSLKGQLEEIITEGIQSDKFGTLCHGDCWNNNILFRYDGEGNPTDTHLLDVEVCRKGSSALDLGYLLYTSVAGETRRPHLESFLKEYYNSYRDVLKTSDIPMHFSLEELTREFRLKGRVGAVYAMLVLPSIFVESVQVPEAKDFSDHDSYANEFRRRLLETMGSHPLTRPRLLDMFDEFAENGLIP